MQDETEKRLIDLETCVAHLEKQFDELNQVIISQARTIQKMQAFQQDIMSLNHQELLDEIKRQIKKPPHSVV